MINTSVDVRLASLNTLKHISKQSPHVLTFDKIRYLIPEFISLLRDRNTAVRASAELTLAFVLQLDKNDILFDVRKCFFTFFSFKTKSNTHHLNKGTTPLPGWFIWIINPRMLGKNKLANRNINEKQDIKYMHINLILVIFYCRK